MRASPGRSPSRPPGPAASRGESSEPPQVSSTPLKSMPEYSAKGFLAGFFHFLNSGLAITYPMARRRSDSDHGGKTLEEYKHKKDLREKSERLCDNLRNSL